MKESEASQRVNRALYSLKAAMETDPANCELYNQLIQGSREAFQKRQAAETIQERDFDINRGSTVLNLMKKVLDNVHQPNCQNPDSHKILEQ